MFSATEVINIAVNAQLTAHAGSDDRAKKSGILFEAREAAIEILGQLTTLAAGIPGASEPSTVALKLRNDAERAIIEQFAQRNLSFDPKTTKVTKLSKH